MKLFIFDFDETIISEHSHNLIANAIRGEEKNNHELQWDVIKNIKPIAGSKAWRQLFLKIAMAGHKIAIASFNAYGTHLIPRYLREVIGLDEEMANKIYIKSELPSEKDKEEHGKRHHIHQIKSFHSCVFSEIILIDDDMTLLDLAAHDGLGVILATPDAAHLKLAEAAISIESNLLKKPSEYTCNSLLHINLVNSLTNANLLDLISSYSITSSYELYYINTVAEISKMVVDGREVKSLLAMLPIDYQKVMNEENVTEITKLMNQEKTYSAFNRLLIKDYTPISSTEDRLIDVPAAESSTPKIIFRRNERNYCEVLLTASSTLREVVWALENTAKTQKSRFKFFINKQEINLNDNNDKSLEEFLQSIYGEQAFPLEISIDLNARDMTSLFS